MRANSAAEILARLRPDDLVLDVGAWACPFNRANWVLDAQPYATRGFYATLGLPASQGGEIEHFTPDTWVVRDICGREPWPFRDRQFDFSICSHTLEDVRDPLAVCAELVRVSKRGYIEVPSRLLESCRGVESPAFAGLSHHRWLVEDLGNHLRFTMKYHMLHGDRRLSFPPSFRRRLSEAESTLCFFWDGAFTWSENELHGLAAIHDELAAYVRARYAYPATREFLDRLCHLARRIADGIGRRLPR